MEKKRRSKKESGPEKKRSWIKSFSVFREIHREMGSWVYASVIGFLIGGSLFFFLYLTVDIPEFPKTQIMNKRPYAYFAYDLKTRQPSWVLEVLTHGEARAHRALSDITVYEETDRAQNTAPQLSDYANSGFDAVPLMTTYSEAPLSSASPQLPLFKPYWEKVDHYVRELTLKGRAMQVAVVTGPLYLQQDSKHGKEFMTYQVIGKNKIAVPSHFFKAIFFLTEDPKVSPYGIDSEIYVVPNAHIDIYTPIANFKTFLKDFEQMSGIIFPEDMGQFIRNRPFPIRGPL